MLLLTRVRYKFMALIIVISQYKPMRRLFCAAIKSALMYVVKREHVVIYL